MHKYHNMKMIKYKMTKNRGDKMQKDKIQKNKIQISQNANVTKYKNVKIQM